MNMHYDVGDAAAAVMTQCLNKAEKKKKSSEDENKQNPS
jgi:hypothetical protein